MKLKNIIETDERDRKLQSAFMNLQKQFGKTAQYKHKKLQLKQKRIRDDFREAKKEIQNFIKINKLEIDDYKETDHYQKMLNVYGDNIVNQSVIEISGMMNADLPATSDNTDRRKKLTTFINRYNKDIRIEVQKILSSYKIVKVTMPAELTSKIDDEMLIDIADEGIYHFGGVVKHREYEKGNIIYTVYVYTN